MRTATAAEQGDSSESSCKTTRLASRLSWARTAAPSSGKLYLRCKDAWNELADNKGVVTVRLQAK